VKVEARTADEEQIVTESARVTMQEMGEHANEGGCDAEADAAAGSSDGV
jgi:hypothetical protein